MSTIEATADLKKLSAKQLKALLKEREAMEKRDQIARRDAYEGIRADLVRRVEMRVLNLAEEVKNFSKFLQEETDAFKNVMAEYGQLRRDNQQSYTIVEGDFKIEVKSSRVKRFDERADAAASRLIDYLQDWIQGTNEGADNPMYQLAMMLLERNKYGDLDYKSISKLYELEGKFNDPDYTSIMDLFRESNITEGTATNYYFYKRNSRGVWVKVEPSFNKL